jgi:hypothetical protein
MNPSKTSGLVATWLVASACSGTIGEPYGTGGQIAVASGGAGTGAQCKSDADCAKDETCEFGSNTCPPDAYCILPAMGTCRPRSGQGGASSTTATSATGGAPTAGGTLGKGGSGSGDCCSNSDCAPGQTCTGAACCPAGAICILPSRPNTCENPIQCSTDIECPKGQNCVQVLFPIYPGPGYDGGLGDIKLGECRDPGASARLETGTRPEGSVDDWWQTVESALVPS